MRDNEEINRFQENLVLIRKILGLSEKELGDKIGVTRQTISSIENQKTKMNKTQYLAMRMVIEDEIRNNEEENEMLLCVLKTIVDNPNEYDKKTKEIILKNANLLAPAIVTKSYSKKEVSKEYKNILEVLGIGVGIVVGVGIVISKNLFKKK